MGWKPRTVLALQRLGWGRLEAWAIAVMVLIVGLTALWIVTRSTQDRFVYRSIPQVSICGGSGCWDAQGAQKHVVMLEVANRKLADELALARAQLLAQPKCGVDEVAWWDMTGKKRICTPSPLPVPIPGD
jgi:hypothetical protein